MPISPTELYDLVRSDADQVTNVARPSTTTGALA